MFNQTARNARRSQYLQQNCIIISKLILILYPRSHPVIYPILDDGYKNKNMMRIPPEERKELNDMKYGTSAKASSILQVCAVLLKS